MSLLSDPDWVIYQLRLSYLRRIDDHHGPRIISFPSEVPSNRASAFAHHKSTLPGVHAASCSREDAYSSANASNLTQTVHIAASDSHIAIGRLNDPAVFPEISTAYSPLIGPQRNAYKYVASASGRTLSPAAANTKRPRHQPLGSTASAMPMARRGSEGAQAALTQAERQSQHQRMLTEPTRGGIDTASPSVAQRSAGLKYTQTIYGPGRSGALGMRVSGKRAGKDVLPPSLSAGVADTNPATQATMRLRGRASSCDAGPLEKGEQVALATTPALPATIDGCGNPSRTVGKTSLTQVDSPQPTAQGVNRIIPTLRDASSRSGFDVEAGPNTPHSHRVPPRSHSQEIFRNLPSRLDPALSRVGDDMNPPAGFRRRRSATMDQQSRATQPPSDAPTTSFSLDDSAQQAMAMPQSSRVVEAVATEPSRDELSMTQPPSTSLSSCSPTGVSRLHQEVSSAAPLRPIKNALRHLQSDSSLSSLISTSDVSMDASPRWHTQPMESGDAMLFGPGKGQRSWDFNQGAAPTRRPSRALSPLARIGHIETGEAEADVPSSLVQGEGQFNSSAEAIALERNAADVSSRGAESNAQSDLSSRLDTMSVSRPSRPILTHYRPSSETLIAARSKLSKPSRSHLRVQTLEERIAEQEIRQNSWFRSLSLSNQQVAVNGMSAQKSGPQPSALSLLLKKQNTAPENPFAQFYAGIAGRSSAVGPLGSARIDVYFPWAQGPATAIGPTRPSGALSVNPSTRCFTLSVRKDATMEELIGYGLYCYTEERWLPSLDAMESPDTSLSTIGWVLRIVEDGEVDDDYPSLDRSLTVGKFGGDEFAICKASAQQIKQHRTAFGAIDRRASRVVAQPIRSGLPGHSAAATLAPTAPSAIAVPTATGAGTAGPGLAVQPGAVLPSGSLAQPQGSPLASPSALSRTTPAFGSALGLTGAPPIFLRVLITPNNQVRYKTTLSVEAEMYLADVLDLICQKRQLGRSDEWALIVPGDDGDHQQDIVVPLDRTVESLQGSHDLALVRRSTLGAQGGTAALAGQSTNPKASIFRNSNEGSSGAGPNGMANVAGAGKGLGLTGLASQSVYKSWTVTRRLPPMFHVGSHRQHERTLTIDGDWIHIIPTDSRAFNTHAASFPITSVASCAQSGKLAHQFKLLVAVKGIQSRQNASGAERQQKRYDLEAEDAKQAAEIVREVNSRRRRSRP
ncbi:unnamed protein product [Parajaminaea phylloscopi]